MAQYALCPAFDMTIDEYRALLVRLALRCERINKVMIVDLNRWESSRLLEAFRTQEFGPSIAWFPHAPAA